MLVHFSVENWMSFRDEASLSMLATRERQHSTHISSIDQYDIKALPAAVIYGGNASGKSNLVKALSFAEKFITENGRIIHVYGRLRKDPPWQLTEINWEAFGPVSRAPYARPQLGPPQYWSDVKRLLDHAYEASQGLQTIAPDKTLAESGSIPDHIQRARKAIADPDAFGNGL